MPFFRVNCRHHLTTLFIPPPLKKLNCFNTLIKFNPIFLDELLLSLLTLSMFLFFLNSFIRLKDQFNVLCLKFLFELNVYCCSTDESQTENEDKGDCYRHVVIAVTSSVFVVVTLAVVAVPLGFLLRRKWRERGKKSSLVRE